MSLNPAKVRVEIFREPIFFDDHFVKNWVADPVGGVALDGDVVTVMVQEGLTLQRYEYSIVFDPNIYRYLIIRITEVSPATTWLARVRRQSDGAWFTIGSGTIAGLYSWNMAGLTTLDKISLNVTNSVGKYAKFDYVGICKNELFVPDLGDLVEELTVTRPLLNNGIAGAKLSIPNFAGAYNGYVKNHDIILIWLARDDANLGVPAYKVFGGRIVNPSNRGEQYGEFYIDLDCHGHAYESNIPPSLLQKYYAGTNGRTIIEDALAICTYLTKHPTASMWFDNAGASGSTDDRINSTHDAVYDEELPATVIQEILEKAKNPAAMQGFDAYETPAGCIVGHLRNSLDFVSPIASIIPESYQKSEDSHRVRNKIKVYGALEKSTSDYAEALTNWTTDGTGPTQDNADLKEGTYSIKAIKNGHNVYLRYTFSSPIKCKFKNQYRKVHIWINVDSVADKDVNWITIQLFTSSGNMYKKEIENVQSGKWIEVLYDLGVGSDWYQWGSPNWESIAYINILFLHDGLDTDLTLKVDGLRLIENFKGETSDSTSQGLYDIRISEPEVDENLKSDAECQARAESILAVLKDPVVTLSDVVVDGDHRYNPGDRQRIVVANDNLDAYFCIVEIKHSVKGTQWDAVLTLSNEPQYVDYVFKLLQEAQKLLERRG